jgi:hypothetical protein
MQVYRGGLDLFTLTPLPISLTAVLPAATNTSGYNATLSPVASLAIVMWYNRNLAVSR